MEEFGRFGGMPPGLQGFLLTRQLNDQATRSGMENAVSGMGILSHIQQIADQRQINQALANNDIPALLRTKGGVDVYKKIIESNNLGVTGQLHSAQISEIARKSAQDQKELTARDALTNLVSSGGYQQNNPGAMPPTQVMQDPASAEAAAKAQYLKDPNTPFAIDVPNPANVRALAIASGSHLNRSAAASMLNPSSGQQLAPRLIQSDTSPTGYGYLNPRDGTITPGAPPPGAAKLVTQDSTAPQPPLTADGEKVKNDLIRTDSRIPKTRRGIIDNEALNSLGKENAGGSNPVSLDRADFAAKKSALTALTKDLTAIRPYNEMLDMNGNIAIDLANKVIKTDLKFANKSLNWLRQNAGDNPDVAEFLAQTTIVTTEAARVLNNPRLVGQLTDSARHEMQAVISGDMPINSFTRVIKRMQSDGNNRVTAMNREQQSLLKSLGSGAVPTDSVVAPKAATGPVKISNDADYNALPSGAEYIAPDGSTRKKK
jgi:hypothetical protein